LQSCYCGVVITAVIVEQPFVTHARCASLTSTFERYCLIRNKVSCRGVLIKFARIAAIVVLTSKTSQGDLNAFQGDLDADVQFVIITCRYCISIYS
jgi:hypothetical protein